MLDLCAALSQILRHARVLITTICRPEKFPNIALRLSVTLRLENDDHSSRDWIKLSTGGKI